MYFKFQSMRQECRVSKSNRGRFFATNAFCALTGHLEDRHIVLEVCAHQIHYWCFSETVVCSYTVVGGQTATTLEAVFYRLQRFFE